MEPKILTNLKPADYTHPLEIRAKEKLLNTKGLKLLVNKFHELGFEQHMQLQYQADCIEVTPHNLNHLHYLKDKAASILNYTEDVTLYVQRSDKLEGISIGVEQPMIIISSEAVDCLSYQELLFVLGREMAHLIHQHALYKEIGLIFPDLMEAFSVVTLGISSIVGSGLKYALYNWDRMSEFTADRGGLLVCQDPEIVYGLFAKLAGWPRNQWDNISLPEFKNQVHNFDLGVQKTFDKVIQYMLGHNSWSIARAKELMDWIEEGSFENLMIS